MVLKVPYDKDSDGQCCNRGKIRVNRGEYNFSSVLGNFGLWSVEFFKQPTLCVGCNSDSLK